MKKEIQHIIFFEDDPLDCEIYKDIITELDPDINCIFYPDDSKINEVIKYCPKSSLIILDLNLKNTDGFELYKKHLQQLDFTVYIHTSSDNPKGISIANQYNISGYFQKQLKHIDIKKQLESIIYFFKYDLKHLY